MYIKRKVHFRDGERRKKRLVLPVIYFIAEIGLLWLIVSLIQLEFSIVDWSSWAIFLFLVAMTYSIAKTVHIFQRQRSLS